jgi:hypothetical protein
MRPPEWSSRRSVKGTAIERRETIAMRGYIDPSISIRQYAGKNTTVEKRRSGFLLNPAVFFMSLFRSHNLIYDNSLGMKIKKYRITIRHMHPVTFFWHREPLYVPLGVRMVRKTINVFRYNTAIFLG